MSGALSAAERWGWIDANPARIAKRPKQPQPQPQPTPPSPSEAARLVDAAFAMDGELDDWGTLVWLVMTTGIRRGEVCALRWSRVDLGQGIIEVRSSYVLRKGVGRVKDTKTHQMRRIPLDTETTVLLCEHKDRCRQRLAELNVELADDMYVFSGVRKFDPTQPY